jgi:microcystin-dependent protein
LGAKPLRSAPSTEFLGGVLVQGTPYIATYNNTDGAFYVRGIFNSPYSVPLGGMLPYVGSSAPNSSFALPYGQAISRTTYASLFALCGTAFGTGDGSTTFNIPELRGRLPVALDTMGGAASGRLTTAGGGIDGTTVGASGGAQSYTMVRSDMPNVQPTFTGSASGQSFATSTNNATVFFGTGSTGSFAQSVNLTAVAAPSGTVQSLNGGVTQTAMKMMPPAIVVPYLIRII